MNTKPIKKPLRISLLALFAVFAQVAAAGAEEAGFLEHYKTGLDAVASENWTRAADLMRKAIDERGTESRRLPKYFYLKPYLPHFYLGLAEFKRGHCEAAERSWGISERQGVVVKRPQYEQMKLGREQCRSRKAPKASTRARSSPPPPAMPPPPARQPAASVAPPPAAWTPGPPDRPPAGQLPPSRPGPPAGHGYARQRLEAPSEPPSDALLAAAAALFDGSYQQAIDQLTAESPVDAYSRAHANLLLAAAELALYQTGGEHDASLLDSARAHVLEVRAALPDLEPPERYFSPRFLDFFYGQRPQEER